jgi:hypothetical protein
MTAIGREIEVSLKSVYGKRWRQGLLVHVLIGLGRSMTKQNRSPTRTICEDPPSYDEPQEEGDQAFRELHENPLDYIRRKNQNLAQELETQFLSIQKSPIKMETRNDFPDFGELLEAIGVQTKLRLEGSDKEDLAALLEAVIQASWEEAPLSLREDALRIIRLLSFFTASIDVP